jgi:hypothetical protein
MQRRTDSFRLNPITLGAVVAGLIAFVITGGLTVLMWVALAASIGAGVGWVVHRVSTHANAYATVEESPSTPPEPSSRPRPRTSESRAAAR